MTFRKFVILTAAGGIAIAGAAYAEVHKPIIGQKNKVFSLQEVNMPQGATIRVENDDNIVHTLLITKPDGIRSDLGLQKPGEQLDITLEQLGDYMVRCGIHPAMKMVVHTR